MNGPKNITISCKSILDRCEIESLGFSFTSTKEQQELSIVSAVMREVENHVVLSSVENDGRLIINAEIELVAQEVEI